MSTASNGANSQNFCFCGHDFTQHALGAAGARSGSGGACLICSDAHIFGPDYGGTSGLPGRPFYGGNALDESQI